MKVSIIAGSKSDEEFVEPIKTILSNNNITWETAYLSAHRDKKALETYVTQSIADYFIAIAGLAAALPGSIAADTNKPVIAVPVWSGSASSPGGLDALLAAVQMPPPKDGKDVAVGCVAINKPEYAAEFVVNSIALRTDSTRKFDVGISASKYVADTQMDLIDKLTGTLDELGLTYHIGGHIAPMAKTVIMLDENPDKVTEYARAADVNKDLRQIISVPIISKTEKDFLKKVLENGIRPYDCVPGSLILHKIYTMAPQGLAVSVGFGNVKNAAYLAKRLLGK